MNEMRTFEHFPEVSKCPLCGTSDDSECLLIPIDGTESGGNCEAQPFHLECFSRVAHTFKFNREAGLLYAHTREGGEDG